MHDVLRYADRLFGKTQGFVAVAFKRRDDSWNEETIAWPRDRDKLGVWAEEHEGANLFICPSLRAHDARRRDDGVRYDWLWADVDWAKVPADRRAEVDKSIDDLATFVVFSGSREDGWDNVHVYVKLDAPVDADAHLRLNTGLRDLLYADNKQTDNSLLRVPGSRNWKTASGPRVAIEEVAPRRVVKAATLARLPVFQAAAKTVLRLTSDGSWQTVALEGVPRKWVRRAAMHTDEAIGRYGSRFKAIWAVTGDMVKAGLDDDVIHTLMDSFPAALSKANDENGYDVHADVGKRIAHLRKLSEAVESLDDDAVIAEVDDDDGVFSDASDDDLRALGPDDPRVRKELERRELKRVADQFEAQKRFKAPPPDITWTVSDALANPPQPQQYLIEGVAGIKHNVLITAQYKAGKTKFIMASVAAALVDGQPFLGSMAVPDEGRNVGHWNCEMDPDEMLDGYIRPVGIENTDRLTVANLRGYGIDITSQYGKAWAVTWLRDHNVQVWTIDSLARLLMMAGVKEKDNDDVLRVLGAIDEIKREADVDVCFLIAHTGRAEMEEGKERARGATVIDDWCDARWIMTKGDDNVRFLMVDGRGTKLDTTSLVYDEDTGRSVLGTAGKAATVADSAVQAVYHIVMETPGLNKTTLKKKMREAGVKGRAASTYDEYIQDAVDTKFVEERRAAGSRRAIEYWPVSMRPVEGGATPLAVDFSRETRRGRGVKKAK